MEAYILTSLEDLRDIDGYIYVATPYTKYKAGIDDAAEIAAAVTADLFNQGFKTVFSPIIHSHVICGFGDIDPYDGDLWQIADKAFVDAAAACIVVKMDGWEESRGVQHEISEFTKAGKPIVYIEY